MKQATLPFGAAQAKQPKRPIVLDDADSDEAQEPEIKETERDLGIGTSKAASSPNRTSKKPRLDTATTVDYPASDPMHIPDLPFDISEVLPKVEPRVIKKDPQELDLLYFNGFVAGSGTRRKDFFEYLRSALPFYRVKYTVRGISINTPRYTTVFGCDPTDAKPSAYKIKPRAIPKVLNDLKNWVEERTDAKYNFVLVNYYKDGNDSISWHSDDESFLGPLPCIASLSLGGSRDFALKHKKDKSITQEKFHLGSGDMVVMRGKTQSCWFHSIPKRKQASGRINITFRKAVNVAGTNNYYRYNVRNGTVHRWSQAAQEMIECQEPDAKT